MTREYGRRGDRGTIRENALLVVDRQSPGFFARLDIAPPEVRGIATHKSCCEVELQGGRTERFITDSII